MKFIKRFLDLVFAILLLPLLVPPMVLIAIAIKIDSKGSVLFRQDRLGYKGRKFKIYKFRTMVENAERMGSGIYTNKEDPRKTKVGNFLRKTSLDELPQLLNIIKGEMSFVGPRPPVTYHPCKYEEYSIEQKKRFEILPGITGLAQISGRNNLSWDERIKIDLVYRDKVSVLLDMKIIILTLIKIFKKEAIYSEGKNTGLSS